MSDIEVFRPITLHCGVGYTDATVMIPADDGPVPHGTYGFVDSPCAGCKFWSVDVLRQVEEGLEVEYGADLSGINPRRAHALHQLLTYYRRTREEKFVLIVAMCTPICCE